MEMIIERIKKETLYTIGRVYIDGEYICDSIEDKDRGLDDYMTEEQIKNVKIKDLTAIPTGKYNLTMKVKSPKFSLKEYYNKYCNGYLPRILNVKGFSGILLHRGTDLNSSSGCIILGYNTIVGKLTDSQKAFETVYSILKSASDKGDNITIEIK